VLLVSFIAAVTLKQQAIETTLPGAAQPGASSQMPGCSLELSADRHLAVNRQDGARAQRETVLRGVCRTALIRRSTSPPRARYRMVP
jgi:hypothetical protein